MSELKEASSDPSKQKFTLLFHNNKVYNFEARSPQQAGG